MGPSARKLAFSLPYDKSKPINSILAIAVCMVPMMVLIMSIYGMIMKSVMVGMGSEGSILTAYLKTVGLNIIAALPAQLLIVGPVSRFLLTSSLNHRLSFSRSDTNNRAGCPRRLALFIRIKENHHHPDLPRYSSKLY